MLMGGLRNGLKTECENIIMNKEKATADNRAYLASADASAKIPLRGTSDTIGTLYDIRNCSLQNVQMQKK